MCALRAESPEVVFVFVVVDAVVLAKLPTGDQYDRSLLIVLFYFICFASLKVCPCCFLMGTASYCMYSTVVPVFFSLSRGHLHSDR